MVVESWELYEANMDVPLFAQGSFVSTCKGHAQKHPLQSSWTSRVIGLEQEESRRVALSSGLCLES